MKTFYISMVFAAALSACGTTYQLPQTGSAENVTAKRMFAEARAEGPRPQLSSSAAEQRFRRVSARVGRAGTQYCQTLTADRSGFDCNVDLAIDRKMTSRNAYFTYDGDSPIIRISMPMLRDSASDDEVAFILSHEYGHLVGRHVEKQQQQQLAGALILGAITAAATSDAGNYDAGLVAASMGIGAAAGSRAYSQTYELESDTLGTRIAYAAGYDPVKGAKFFARPEQVRTTSGNLSFWGTHPPDEKRLAIVLATVEQINANVGLAKAR
ncbi:M48 family metalloprotease [Parasedimentitalea huanghaiensis]|nr:M48 family metalloprotease [Zongyanglinia huanghaiensis]